MEHTEDRIAALEARVAALQARLDAREQAPDGPNGHEPRRPVDRRALLRGAVAGLAGAAAAPALLVRPVAAATGDPLLIGSTANATSTTDAETRLTATNNPATPVLHLKNDAALTSENGARSVLRIAPSAGFVDPSVGDVGDLMVSDLTTSTPSTQGGAYLNFAHTGSTSGDSEVFWGNVYTSAFASFIQFLSNPVRVLDTRTGTGQRLNAQQSIVINLGESAGTVPPGGRQIAPQGLVTFGIGAIVNLTAVSPLGTGFLSVWPSGPRPNASALNFVKAVNIANFSIVALAPTDSFLVFASQTTHVLVDVIGFVVPDVGLVGSQSLAAAQGAAAPLSAPRSSRHIRR